MIGVQVACSRSREIDVAGMPFFGLLGLRISPCRPGCHQIDAFWSFLRDTSAVVQIYECVMCLIDILLKRPMQGFELP